MIYLDELEISLKKNKNRLVNQKQNFLNKFIELELNENILSVIDENLINYFKNNMLNYDLSQEDVSSINKSFNYFSYTKKSNINLSNLFFEDHNILSLKENIKLLYKKSLEYRDIICSNFDSQILIYDRQIDNIFKIKEILKSNNIDIIQVINYISSLPFTEKQKFDILEEVYNKYISNLKSKDKKIEIKPDVLIERIVKETEPSPEIEAKIEKDGIKLEINQEDRYLQELIQTLSFNTKKLVNKVIEEIHNESNTNQDAYMLLIHDKAMLESLSVKIEELQEKVKKYFNDKDIVWENDIPKEELEQEFKEIYTGILNEYKECNILYEKLYENYRKRREVNLVEINDSVIDNLNNDSPIIFWFGNNQIIDENNYSRVEEFLQEFDAYPEDTFYSNDLLPALNLLKKQASFVKFKEQGLFINTIDEIRGVRNAIPFKEIKLRNGNGGGTARIYYNTFKTNQGKNYVIIYLINNKTDAYDKESYQVIEGYLKSKIYQHKLGIELDNPEIIQKFQELEKYVFQQVEQRVAKEQSLNHGGNK